MSGVAGSPVCVFYHDFNDPDPVALYGVYEDHCWHYGLKPEPGDLVEFWDPDPGAGRCSAVVKRVVEGGCVPGISKVEVEYIEGTWRSWDKDERPTSFGSVPDWMLRAYEAMSPSSRVSP